MIFNDYAKFYDQIYADKDYKKEAEFVYKWAGKPKSILEIGCGTGKHYKYFPKKCSYTGIDTSQEMIDACPITTPTKFFCYSITDWIKTTNGINYDTVFALFNVVGYVDIEKFIENLPLKKGGYFIFDCWMMSGTEPQTTRKNFGSLTKRVLPIYDGVSHYTMEIILTEGNKILSDEIHTVRKYSEGEIEKGICRGYGYEVVDIKYDAGWTKYYKLRKL